MGIQENEVAVIGVDSSETTRYRMPKKPWYAFFLSPLWLCFLIALLVRGWLVIHTHGVIDGDEALVGIQADQILHGVFPSYFYGQAYMGTLEEYLLAVFFAIAGPSVWAMRAEPTLLSLLAVWLTWKLAGLLAEAAHLSDPHRRIFQTIAAVWAAILPLYDVVLEMRLLLGYLETFILILILLIAALQLTRRWQQASGKELTLRWGGIGFVVGLGMWVNPLIVSGILAAALWIIGYCVKEVALRSAIPRTERLRSVGKKLLLVVAAIPACIIGLLPAIIWGASNQWANVAYIHGLGGSFSLQRLHTILRVTKAYGNCIAPHIIGGALPVESRILTILHWPLLLFGLACILATLGLLTVSFLEPAPALSRIRQLAGLPMLFAACAAFVFCASSVAVFELLGCTLDDSGRYATPMMLALPFFFATVITAASLYLDERSKERAQGSENGDMGASRLSTSPAPHSRTRLVLAGQIVLFTILLVYLAAQGCTYILSDPGRTFQSNYCPVDPANNDPIIAYMQREHIQYFWANNFLAYPIVFKTGSTIIGADPVPLMHPRLVPDRVPSYSNAVRHADRPSLLIVIPANDSHPLLLRLLDARHVTYREAIFPSQPGYNVLVATPLNRTVSPFEKGFDIFYCVSS